MHKLPTATTALPVYRIRILTTATLGAYFRYFLLSLPAHRMVATPTLPVQNAQTSYSQHRAFCLRGTKTLTKALYYYSLTKAPKCLLAKKKGKVY